MKTKHYLIVFLALMCGFGLGWFVKQKNQPAYPQMINEVRENLSGSVLINPLLYVNTSEGTAREERHLNIALENYINKKTNGTVSVYFRELNTGNWTGVNEDSLYEPSSMLKVLVMLSYLKLLRSDPAALNTLINYTNKTDPGQTFKPQKELASGKYPASELIERMIIDSDNQATEALVKANQEGFNLVYNTLKLPPAPKDRLQDFLSPKSYSVLFRILYNSSYVSRNLSDQALQLLTKTTFTKGLVAGVPNGTIVAHKFGEQTIKYENGIIKERQLHDCGIVYFPSNPYFICVMTKGTDFEKLETIISDISRIVYTEVKGIQ